MQASRVVSSALRATVPARAGFADKSVPNLVKVWKSHVYTRNQRIQQLSPFELDVMGPMFRNIGEKIKHRVEDNFFDVAPPLLFFAGLITFVQWKRSEILMHHRD